MATGVALPIVGPEQRGQVIATVGPRRYRQIGQQRPGFAMVQGYDAAVARQAGRAKEV